MINLQFELDTESMPDLSNNTSKALKSTVNELSLELLLEISKRAPAKKGALRSSFSRIVVEANDTATATITSNAPYAPIVEYGSKPHAITPRNSKALRFTLDNNTVFVKSVKHPGSKGRFFIKSSVDAISSKVASIFAKHLLEVENR